MSQKSTQTELEVPKRRQNKNESIVYKVDNGKDIVIDKSRIPKSSVSRLVIHLGSGNKIVYVMRQDPYSSSRVLKDSKIKPVKKADGQ